MPKFTIITVVLNNAKYIEASIKSVLSQTYSDIEYIIIDGGSTDGTLEIISRYKEQLDLLISEPDNGIYDAMNKGLRHATGEWVLMLNSDDYLLDTDILKKVSEEVESECGMVYGTALMKFEENDFLEDYSTELTIQNLSRGKVPPHMAVFLQRDVVLGLGGYDTKFSLAADFDFYIRFLRAGYQSKKIEVCCSVFRIHDDARSPFRIHKFWAESAQIIRQHFGCRAFVKYRIKVLFGSALRYLLLGSGSFGIYRTLRKRLMSTSIHR